ncbi:MAG: hypothetical protein AB1938_26930, partial [Myxococcota bacterium]
MFRPAALALGVALSCAALLSSSSCGGTKKTCSISTCQGCCDAAGECQPGSTTAACGSSGSFCSVCPGAQLCQLGVCIPISGTGGGATGGGGGGGATGGGGGGGATGGGGGG